MFLAMLCNCDLYFLPHLAVLAHTKNKPVVLRWIWGLPEIEHWDVWRCVGDSLASPPDLLSDLLHIMFAFRLLPGECHIAA